MCVYIVYVRRLLRSFQFENESLHCKVCNRTGSFDKANIQSGRIVITHCSTVTRYAGLLLLVLLLILNLNTTLKTEVLHQMFAVCPLSKNDPLYKRLLNQEA